MRIVNSQTTMSSDHTRVAARSRQERLRMWGNTPSEMVDPRRIREEPEEAGDEVSLGEEELSWQAELREASIQIERSTERLKVMAQKAQKKLETEVTESTSLSAESSDMKVELMRLIVEHLTGEEVQLYSTKLDDKEGAEDGEAPEKAEEAAAEGARERVGWGVEYDLHEMEMEAERTSFSSSGVVKTADGREIAFDVNLMMSREHIEVRNFSLRAGDARPVDPLVINFGGSAAQLTEAKTEFDLDADGEAESISFVRSGSGFLALDRNRDGVVNNGSELFGPKTGDGFVELAEFDEDGNGWIDEGDSVYSDLRIWTKDGQGVDQLWTLQDKNVGAIHLGRVSTPFQLKDSNNDTDGIVRSTGVYLEENGSAGTVQQVDLVT